MTHGSQSAPAQARRQQRVEELCVAAIRALTGEPDLHFRGRLLHRGDRALPLHAPQLHPAPDDDFGSFRGAADGMALRLLHSADDVHRTLAPHDPVERLLFEMLEQFRVESLATPRLPGLRDNLRYRFERWSLAFHHAGLTETGRGVLLYTVAQVCRARVTREPVVEETEDLLETTRGEIAPLLGPHLADLRRHRADQRAYARPALAIARTVAQMLETAAEGHDDHADDPARLPLFVDFEDETDDGGSTASDAADGATPAGSRYRVFTTAYDREVDVAALVRPPLLRQQRDLLDQRVREQRVNLPRLARRLRALLATPYEQGWTGGQEEGHIDGRRLSRLITSPTERRLFQTVRTEAAVSTLVTLLVDCSGSMKAYAEHVALVVDVLGRALDLAGASTEVLGFTTGAWNGGRALRDWRRAGRPAEPGRLTEVQHVVFKDARVRWRDGRRGVAGLLKEDLFREGVDGEAVHWAAARMDRRTEQRRILLVFSDGSPMDSATSLTNGDGYLDDHLGSVVRRLESAGSPQVHGVGVGLDLSPYYPRALALDLSSGVSNRVFDDLVGLLARRGPAR